MARAVKRAGGPTGAAQEWRVSHSVCVCVCVVWSADPPLTALSSGDGDGLGVRPSCHCHCRHHAGVVIEGAERLHPLAGGAGGELQSSARVLLCDVDAVAAQEAVVLGGRRGGPGEEEA